MKKYILFLQFISHYILIEAFDLTIQLHAIFFYFFARISIFKLSVTLFWRVFSSLLQVFLLENTSFWFNTHVKQIFELEVINRSHNSKFA